MENVVLALFLAKSGQAGRKKKKNKFVLGNVSTQPKMEHPQKKKNQNN